MFHRKFLTISLAALIFCLSGFLATPVFAQAGDDTEAQKQKVAELIEQYKYTEALPLLEKLVVAEPDNGHFHYYLGFALIAQANTIKDKAERKALSLRARNAFLKAKNLNVDEPVLDALIASIPPDGSEAPSFSSNIVANSLMVEAESFFAQGKADEALVNYQKALELDPKLYYAALFSGDVFLQKGKLAEASMWYERAIAIDPTKETAYRYSATPLMKQDKIEAARDRYVEAFITEPYNKFARGGLVQWATATKTPLAHPTIDIPSDVKFDDKGNANISIDAGALLSGKDDGGAFAWISYGTTRTAWHKEKFAKTFPKESVYRHSLPEEAEALRSVIALATSDKKAKLSPSIRKLKKLDDEGLLEAYILLGRADAGIAQDHPEYLKANRDKLRRYMIEYVLAGGGPA